MLTGYVTGVMAAAEFTVLIKHYNTRKWIQGAVQGPLKTTQRLN